VRLHTITKVCLIVLVVLTVLLGGGFIALQSVNTQTLRSIITEQVQAATGRTLNIAGPLKLHWGLVPSLLATDVSLSNPVGSAHPEMVRLSRLELELAVIPLLRREIVVHRLIITAPDIVIETEMHGPGNLDFTPPIDSRPTEQMNKQLSVDSGAFTSFQFIVKELKIIDGRLRWYDRDTQKTQSFPIYTLTMQTEAADQGLMHIGLSTALQGRKVTATGRMGSPFSLESGKPWLLDLHIITAGLRGHVHGSIADLAAQQGVSLAFTMEGTEVMEAVHLFGINVSDTPLQVGNFRCAGQLQGDRSQLHVDNITFTAGDKQLLLFTAEGRARDLTGALSVDMNTTLESEKPSTLAQQVGLTYHGEESLHIAGRIQGGNSSWNVTALQARIGANNLDGNLHIRLAERVTLTGAVTSTFFNPADFYAGAPGKTGTSIQTQDTAVARQQVNRVFPRTSLPMTFPPLLDTELSVQIKGMPIEGWDVHNIALTAALQNRRLHIYPFYCELAGGTLNADATVDAAGSSPGVTLQVQGDQIEIGRLTKGAVLSGGKSRLNMNVTAHGSSVDALMASATGEVSLSIGEGRLHNKALDTFSGDIFTQVLRMINPLDKRRESSQLVCAAARFLIRDGVATANQGIGLRTSQVDVLGSGTINLQSEKIEFYITPKPRGKTGLSLTTPLAGLIKIEGTLGAPSVGIDKSGVLKTATSVGVGIATGGLSTLGEFILDKTAADLDPCQTALGLSPQKKSSPQPSSPLKKFSKPLQKLFER
jgi:uncharacterized protein involved in outer membrane biogenesis